MYLLTIDYLCKVSFYVLCLIYGMLNVFFLLCVTVYIIKILKFVILVASFFSVAGKRHI